jgi:hypothetical protein
VFTAPDTVDPPELKLAPLAQNTPFVVIMLLSNVAVLANTVTAVLPLDCIAKTPLASPVCVNPDIPDTIPLSALIIVVIIVYAINVPLDVKV